MISLGIDTNTLLVYEGTSTWGHAIWPSPVMIAADVMSSVTEQLKGVETWDLLTVPLIFREDAFDPVSRVRRGRFYIRNTSQPTTWQVHPHPALGGEEREANKFGVIPKTLATFHSYQISQKILSIAEGQPLVILGIANQFTVWTIVSIETSMTREEIVALRSRASFGALPVINHGRLPASGKDNVLSAVAKLAEDVYRAGPESVVDRAREAATAVLSAYLQDRKIAKPGLDLDALIKIMNGERKFVAANAANIVRLFHSRGKTAVQEKLSVRPLREQDAELAVQCIGTILCELGWADWV